jgi:hypothetical protein
MTKMVVVQIACYHEIRDALVLVLVSLIIIQVGQDGSADYNADLSQFIRIQIVSFTCQRFSRHRLRG